MGHCQGIHRGRNMGAHSKHAGWGIICAAPLTPKHLIHEEMDRSVVLFDP